LHLLWSMHCRHGGPQAKALLRFT